MTIFIATLYWLFTIKTTAYSRCINKNEDYKKLLQQNVYYFHWKWYRIKVPFLLSNKEKAKVFRTGKLKLKLQVELPITSVSHETDPGSNSISFMPLQYSFPWNLLKCRISCILAVIVYGQGNPRMCFKDTSSFFQTCNTKRFVSSPSEQ